MRFLVDTLCIFFSFAAGYYRNMVLFAVVALAFWAYCLFWRYRPDGADKGADAPGAGKN